MPGIVTDCLIPYGARHVRSPVEHIDTNHFGPEVAGSRITAWQDFASMWADIESAVLESLEPDTGIRAYQLSFDREIGLEGVLPLSEAPGDKLAVEERNGQPSLYCEAPEARKPTTLLTVVVGPSKVEPGDIEGYAGHDEPFVLFTVYPGAPSQPFPRCPQEKKAWFELQLEHVAFLLKKGEIEEGQKSLLEIYLTLDGEEDWAHYWSQHVLLHGPNRS